MDGVEIFVQIGFAIAAMIMGGYGAFKSRMANNKTQALPTNQSLDELKLELAKNFGEERGKLEDKIGALGETVATLEQSNKEKSETIKQLQADVKDLTVKYQASNEKIIKLVDENDQIRQRHEQAQTVIASLENEKLQIEKQLIANIAAKEAVLETLAVLHIRLQPTPPDDNGGGNGGGGGGKSPTVSPMPTKVKGSQLGSDVVTKITPEDEKADKEDAA